MRRLAVLLALVLAAPAAADVLLGAHELRGWDVLAEAPVGPHMDPDLAEWGVAEKRVRHYTRMRGGAVEVCSVEVWRFDSVAQATAAAQGFAFPDWRIDRVGAVLVMLHGRSGVRRGVFPACQRLGARVRDRAS